MRLFTLEDSLPDLVAFGFSLLRVHENDILKVGLEIGHKLRGECDFGNEEDGGFLVFCLFLCEFNINVSFAGTGNTVE